MLQFSSRQMFFAVTVAAVAAWGVVQGWPLFLLPVLGAMWCALVARKHKWFGPGTYNGLVGGALGALLMMVVWMFVGSVIVFVNAWLQQDPDYLHVLIDTLVVGLFCITAPMVLLGMFVGSMSVAIADSVSDSMNGHAAGISQDE